MELTVLTVPGCPNGPVLHARLADVVAGVPGIRVTWRVISSEREATAAGMRGSPTLLVDGVDPFADGGAAGMSCRIYRDAHGAATGSPSTAGLRAALGLPGTPQRPAPSP